MGFGNSKNENNRVNEADTKHATLIPESASDILYNSIVKIIMKNGLQGTGFFMKIKIKEEQKNCLFTCNHVINEKNIDSKETFDIYYGKITQEINKKIILDTNIRLIKTFKRPIDITLVEIIESDHIPNDKYLIPDYNYKNGFEYYKDKSFYMAGYPRILGKKDERCICSGQIKEIDEFDFEHTLDSRGSSSGSPICLIDNKCVVGIHKQGDLYKPINYGTFLGIILDKIQNDESNEVTEEEEEHEFHFSNIKTIGQIENEEIIDSVLLLDEKYVSGKEKFLVVKSVNQICIYYLNSKKLKFKIHLDSKNNEYYDDHPYSNKDKLEIVDNKYYKELPTNSFLLITKKYKIEIYLQQNKGKIIDSISNYFDNFKSRNLSIKVSNNIIEFGEFISNLDIFSQGKDLENLKENKDKYFIYFFNKNFYLEKKFEKKGGSITFEINGKFFIHYIYMRGLSTSSVYDINNSYQKIYEKIYFHQGNLTTIDNCKYLIFPPPSDFNFGYEFNRPCKYTFFNLENFSERLIEISDEVYNSWDEPIIIHKFKCKKYLRCQSPCFGIKKSKWTIIEEKEGKFFQKEKADDDKILGDNTLFLKNNVIISWNFTEKIITFLSY